VRAALRLKQELDRRQARERELLSFLSSWGDRRASIWMDEVTGLFVGEVAEAYLAVCGSDAEEVISILTLMLDRFDVGQSSDSHSEARGTLAVIARAVRRLVASIGVVAAAYKNGMIVLVAPELGATAALKLAEELHATVQKLRLPNPESITSDYITASVAVITGQGRSDIDRIHLLTHAIASVQQAVAAGGNRVLALSADETTPRSGSRVWQNFISKKEFGATV
jgi:GGDEF domain-containing protein